jgi:hypothetical protein
MANNPLVEVERHRAQCRHFFGAWMVWKMGGASFLRRICYFCGEGESKGVGE